MKLHVRAATISSHAFFCRHEIQDQERADSRAGASRSENIIKRRGRFYLHGLFFAIITTVFYEMY
jgi:hypothetical protein